MLRLHIIIERVDFLNFFDYIVDFFTLIWDVIQNIFSAITNLFLVVSNSLSLPLLLVDFLPGIVGTSVIIVVGIGVTKLILGWGNS